jgi:glycine hydroxymethyltransferase
VAGGTQNHLFLVDLREKTFTGKQAEQVLEQAHITLNKNMLPNDPRSPFVTSGLRIGTPALTTRGLREKEAKQVAGWMADVLDDIENHSKIEEIRQQVIALCRQFPVYSRT